MDIGAEAVAATAQAPGGTCSLTVSSNTSVGHGAHHTSSRASSSTEACSRWCGAPLSASMARLQQQLLLPEDDTVDSSSTALQRPTRPVRGAAAPRRTQDCVTSDCVTTSLAVRAQVLLCKGVQVLPGAASAADLGAEPRAAQTAAVTPLLLQSAPNMWLAGTEAAAVNGHRPAGMTLKKIRGGDAGSGCVAAAAAAAAMRPQSSGLRRPTDTGTTAAAAAAASLLEPRTQCPPLLQAASAVGGWRCQPVAAATTPITAAVPQRCTLAPPSVGGRAAQLASWAARNTLLQAPPHSQRLLIGVPGCLPPHGSSHSSSVGDIRRSSSSSSSRQWHQTLDARLQ